MVKKINTLLIIYLYADKYFVIHLCRNQFRVLLDIILIETTKLKNSVERLNMDTTMLQIIVNRAKGVNQLVKSNPISFFNVSRTGNS